MTTLDKIRIAVCAELDRHAVFLSTVGLRAVRFDVKITPTGDIRAVIFTPEVERSLEREPVGRPRTFGGEPPTGRGSAGSRGDP